MVFTLSFKVLVVMVLSVLVFAQFINAQYEIDDDYEAPECPNSSLVFYRNCRGSLDECSKCLGNAERDCEDDFKKRNETFSICFYCTKQVAGNCNNIKKMCFGNQECQQNEKCLDYNCVYQSPSR